MTTSQREKLESRKKNDQKWAGKLTIAIVEHKSIVKGKPAPNLPNIQPSIEFQHLGSMLKY